MTSFKVNKLKISFADEYVAALPEGHKFPISKYKLIPERLISEGLITAENLVAPGAAPEDIVCLTHDSGYVSRVKNLSLSAREIRKIGFPLTSEFSKREFIISQGTINGALAAIENCVSFNVAGGTHHAFPNEGSGFCIFNDVAVAANYLLHKNIKEKILIIDLDVHQGNGTAKIFENEKRVFTFSMHSGCDWPLRKEKSNLDIELRKGTGDAEYIEILKKNLPWIIEDFQPDFAFYISGADIIESDKWGSLNLSVKGAAERDKYVFTTCRKNNLPVMVTMGGGYSEFISIIVETHCNTFREGIKLYFG